MTSTTIHQHHSIGALRRKKKTDADMFRAADKKKTSELQKISAHPTDDSRSDADNCSAITRHAKHRTSRSHHSMLRWRRAGAQSKGQKRLPAFEKHFDQQIQPCISCWRRRQSRKVVGHITPCFVAKSWSAIERAEATTRVREALRSVNPTMVFVLASKKVTESRGSHHSMLRGEELERNRKGRSDNSRSRSTSISKSNHAVRAGVEDSHGKSWVTSLHASLAKSWSAIERAEATTRVREAIRSANPTMLFVLASKTVTESRRSHHFHASWRRAGAQSKGQKPTRVREALRSVNPTMLFVLASKTVTESRGSHHSMLRGEELERNRKGRSDFSRSRSTSISKSNHAVRAGVEDSWIASLIRAYIVHEMIP